MPLIYDDLCRFARRYLAREPGGFTRQPEGLVHEAYLRLAQCRSTPWRSRQHLFCTARRLLRRILIDRARRRACAKRGSNRQDLSFDEALAVPEIRGLEGWWLDAAMVDLARAHPRQGRVVELLYVFGFSQKESAEILGVARNTVQKDSMLARRWLQEYLSENPAC